MVGFAVAIVLAVQDEPVGYEIGLWIVASGVFAAFGAGLAAVAAAVALKLHKQAVLPVAVAGVLVIAALSRVADGIH